MKNKSKIIEQMDNAGMLDYGKTISERDLLLSFGHTQLTDNYLQECTSIDAVKIRLKSDEWAALEISDAIREALYDKGRYFGKDNGIYRVYLPSENEKVANNLMKGGDRKYSRAARLMSNTDPKFVKTESNISDRLAVAKRRADKLKNRDC